MLLSLIVNLILKSLVLGLVVGLVPGIKVKGCGSLILTAFLLGLANAFIKPILVYLSFPFMVVSFGLFSIVINAAILKMISGLMDEGFEIDGCAPAIVAAILLSILSMLISWILGITVF